MGRPIQVSNRNVSARRGTTKAKLKPRAIGFCLFAFVALVALLYVTSLDPSLSPSSQLLTQFQQLDTTTRQATTNHTTITTTTDIPQAKATIAYATLLSSCPEDMDKEMAHVDQWQKLLDAAAVLKHSVHLSSIRNYAQSGSRYDYQMYAFIHPSAEKCSAAFRDIGYTVMILPNPVELQDIANPEYAKMIDGSGCCSEKEFIKLNVYKLTKHPIAMFLDFDAFVLKPYDDIFDAMLIEPQENNAKTVKEAMWDKQVSHPINGLYVKDYNNNLLFRTPDKIQIQGGFLIARVNPAIYDEFVKIITKGEFKDGYGWGKEGWGGYRQGLGGSDRFQGIVAYFYDGIQPNTSVELNRCTHCANSGRSYLKKGKGKHKKKVCPTLQSDEDCQDCSATPLEDIYSVHLTISKPWDCLTDNYNTTHVRFPKLLEFHKEWHRIRHDYEATQLHILHAATQGDDTNAKYQHYGHCIQRPGDDKFMYGYEYLPIPFSSAVSSESEAVAAIQ